MGSELLSEPIDALDQSLQHTTTEHKGATVADEGKRYAGNRHQPDGHGDVNEYVDREQHRHAEGEKSAEAVTGKARDAYAVP